jgi:hypothetical protein
VENLKISLSRRIAFVTIANYFTELAGNQIPIDLFYELIDKITNLTIIKVLESISKIKENDIQNLNLRI